MSDETIEVECSVCGNNQNGYMVGTTPVSESHQFNGQFCSGSGCIAYTYKVDL